MVTENDKKCNILQTCLLNFDAIFNEITPQTGTEYRYIWFLPSIHSLSFPIYKRTRIDVDLIYIFYVFTYQHATGIEHQMFKFKHILEVIMDNSPAYNSKFSEKDRINCIKDIAHLFKSDYNDPIRVQFMEFMKDPVTLLAASSTGNNPNNDADPIATLLALSPEERVSMIVMMMGKFLNGILQQQSKKNPGGKG